MKKIKMPLRKLCKQQITNMKTALIEFRDFINAISKQAESFKNDIGEPSQKDVAELLYKVKTTLVIVSAIDDMRDRLPSTSVMEKDYKEIETLFIENGGKIIKNNK